MDIITTNIDVTQLDYFQVDTEGFDYEVIKMIDFNVVKPRIIKYESVNLNKDDQKNIMIFLKENGYYIFQEFGDTVGFKLQEIKL